MKESCWSCGQHCALCKGCEVTPCCDSPQRQRVTAPKEPPPHCGGHAVGVDPELVLRLQTQEMEHYCCKCKKPYKATFNQWVFGTCPHCGASGDGVETPPPSKPQKKKRSW